MSRDADPRDARRLPWALLAYALALAVFLLVPPMLTGEAGLHPGFTWQEALDLATPIVVIPLAWLIADLAGGLGRLGTIVFLVIAAVWVEGQAIHLATNGVGDTLVDCAEQRAFHDTVPGALTYWYDEWLSHWLWHAGWAALSVLLLAVGSRPTAATGGVGPWLAVAAGAVHGFVFGVVTIEGETYPLGIVLSLILAGWGALELQRGPRGRPVVGFFVASSLVTLGGYLFWAIVHGWPLVGIWETIFPGSVCPPA